MPKNLIGETEESAFDAGLTIIRDEYEPSNEFIQYVETGFPRITKAHDIVEQVGEGDHSALAMKDEISWVKHLWDGEVDWAVSAASADDDALFIFGEVWPDEYSDEALDLA